MKDTGVDEREERINGVEFGWRSALVRAAATILIAVGLLALIRYFFM